MDDEAIKANIEGYLPQNRVIYPEITKPEVIPVISDEDKEGKKLLVSVAEEPLIGISERYRRMYINPKTGNQCKQILIKQELVKEVSIKTSKARIKLLELTDKGREKLRELDYDVSGSLRHGGVEHQYWVAQVKKKLIDAGYHPVEEYPIGNGETIDLVVIGKDKKIAIEIETGKSDAVRNIRKCLDAGFEVVSVATKKEVLGKMRLGLGRLSEWEQQRIRLRSIREYNREGV